MTKKTPVIIAFINLKGGVGKTALSVNFAAFCGKEGMNTLLIDLDPQANATFSCITIEEWQKAADETGTVANLLGVRSHTSAEGKEKKAEEIVRKAVFPNVDLIPSHLELFTVDLDLGSQTARETKLKRATKEFIAQYEIVVCDCPPNLTIPTQNAIAMSTHYVVPVSPDFLSSLGVALLVTRVEKLSGDLENNIEHAGIVMSRVGRPSQFREQTKQTLRQTFGKLVFESEIKERSSVTESTAKNKSIFEFDTAGPSAKEFEAFAKELLERLKK